MTWHVMLRINHFSIHAIWYLHMISQSLLYFHCIHLGLHLNHLGFANISVQTKWNECGFFIKFKFNYQIHETEIVMSHDVKCNDAFWLKFNIHMFLFIFISFQSLEIVEIYQDIECTTMMELEQFSVSVN